MKTLVAAAVLALVPLALGSPAVAEADPPTCQGQPATIVGEPGEEWLEGTDGPDVVVSGGASRVGTGEGDDLVCVTGSTDDGYRVRVDTGSGEDSVVVSTTNTVKAFLGPGEDTFVGGDERDDARGGEVAEIEVDGEVFEEYVDQDPDSISTGGGDDYVMATRDDTVALGAGADSLSFWRDPLTGPIGHIDGGPGENLMWFDGGRGGRWVLDNSVGSMSQDGEVQLSWIRFTRFDVSALGPLVLRGSAKDEYFNAYSLRSFVTVDAGAGNDEIVTWNDLGEVRLIDGGPGRDLVNVEGNQYANSGSFDVDLASGSYRYHQDGDAVKVPLAGIEDVEVTYFPQVTMDGDAKANRLTVRVVQLSGSPSKRCRVVVSGGGGKDRLTVTSGKPRQSSKNCPAPVLDGQAGNDLLVGSLLDERLIGGPGRDVARGGPGRDVCIAETRMGCERR